MRKKERETSIEEAYTIFDESAYATVSMIDDEHKPYAVMISPIRINEDIYFHCALAGKKLDCLTIHDEVCVSALSTMQIAPERYTVEYASCILMGKASIVQDALEKHDVLYRICEKYSADFMDGVDEMINKALAQTCIVKIHITSISGKRSKKVG